MSTARVTRRGLAAAAVATAATTSLVACAPSKGSGGSGSDGAGAGGEPVTIYLTRHGETMLNELDRVQGWADSPLTDPGSEVAKQLGTGLAKAGIEFGGAYCADMVRHYTTAHDALDTAGSSLEPERDERLREMAFGPFEGDRNAVMWDAIAEDQGYADQKALMADMGKLDYLDVLDSIAVVAGDTDLPVETSADVSERALKALDAIGAAQTKAGGGNVLVVSSGITIMCVLTTLKADLSNVHGGIENAAVSTLVYEAGTWKATSVNDTHFVEEGAAD